MEGKLAPLLLLLPLLLLFALCAPVSARAAAPEREKPFKMVLFTCMWRRPLLTEFVFAHYAAMRPGLLETSGIDLQLFAVGSEGAESAALARRFNATYAEHPNSPLGAKHNLGLQSLRAQIPDLDAVVIIGSDDLLNAPFFHTAHALLTRATQPAHLIGLRDLHVYDLISGRLAYTPGYRVARTRAAATLGLGRVLSRPLLDALAWRLWDPARQRGLDQSAVRRLLAAVLGLDAVTVALRARPRRIVALDVKTAAAPAGTNIWPFDALLQAAGPAARLRQFEPRDPRAVLTQAFGPAFWNRLAALKQAMSAERR